MIAEAIRRLTWGVDGFGRAFILRDGEPQDVIACVPNAGSAAYICGLIQMQDARPIGSPDLNMFYTP